MAVEYVIFALAVILFIVFIVIWSLHFISLSYGKYKFHKKAEECDLASLPGVSIIKPLMGVDDNLRSNLESFFSMNYPKYELLFCVQDNTDPVISLVRDLIELHPQVDARLFSGGKMVGINPKINNMMQGYERMKYELFLISDAGLKMGSDTLYDMVSLMKSNVGLVHQMPYVCDRPGFAGVLEKVYFGTCHSRMYLFINLIGINCVTGMSCLMRREVIEKVGGLQKFGNYIAEDYFLAQTFLDNGWIIQLSHQPAQQNSANFSIPTWQKRMIRWCKLRLKLSVMSWLEPMQECFMLGICTAWTVNVLFGWSSLVFFLVHVLMWFICDYIMLSLVQNGKLPFSKLEYILAWLYRETICFYLFLKAASNPTVKWRDGQYRLRWGGLAEEIQPKMGGASMKQKLSAKDSALRNQSSTNKLLNSNGTSNNDDEEDMDDDDDHQITAAANNNNNNNIDPTTTATTITMTKAIDNQASTSAATAVGSVTINMNGIDAAGTTSTQLNPTKVARAPLLNHKRTSSFTAMINSGSQQNNNNYNSIFVNTNYPTITTNNINNNNNNQDMIINNSGSFLFNNSNNNNNSSSSNSPNNHSNGASNGFIATTNAVNGNTNKLKTPGLFNNHHHHQSSRSNHQYHHSISNPFSNNNQASSSSLSDANSKLK